MSRFTPFVCVFGSFSGIETESYTNDVPNEDVGNEMKDFGDTPFESLFLKYSLRSFSGID